MQLLKPPAGCISPVITVLICRHKCIASFQTSSNVLTNAGLNEDAFDPEKQTSALSHRAVVSKNSTSAMQAHGLMCVVMHTSCRQSGRDESLSEYRLLLICAIPSFETSIPCAMRSCLMCITVERDLPLASNDGGVMRTQSISLRSGINTGMKGAYLYSRLAHFPSEHRHGVLQWRPPGQGQRI